MYEGCFLQTRLSKTLDVSVDQMNLTSICFKTLGRAFEGLREKYLKSSAACYNTAHAVTSSHDTNSVLFINTKIAFIKYAELFVDSF